MFSTRRMKPMAALAGVLLFSAVAAEAQSFATGGYARGGEGMRTMKMMNAMDADKDHMISKAEFMAYNEKLFAMMDKNKDGMVSADEWLDKQRKISDGAGR